LRRTAGRRPRSSRFAVGIVRCLAVAGVGARPAGVGRARMLRRAALAPGCGLPRRRPFFDRIAGRGLAAVRTTHDDACRCTAAASAPTPAPAASLAWAEALGLCRGAFGGGLYC